MTLETTGTETLVRLPVQQPETRRGLRAHRAPGR